MSIKVGVIGAGRIGECHVKAYKKLDNVEIIGAADISGSRRQYMRGRYDLKVFADMDDLLEMKPDIVSVCTPDFDHVVPTMKAAEIGAHILCEKPIATTIEDARRMISEAKRCGVYLGIGYKFRYDNIYRETKRIIEDRAIGDVVMIYMARPQEVSEVLAKWPVEESVDISNLCHEIDLSYWLHDSEPRYVYANYQKGIPSRKNPTRVTLFLEHDHHAQSILYCGIESEFPRVGGTYDSKFHIVGTEGYILGERPSRLVVCNDLKPSVRLYPADESSYYQQAFDSEVGSFVRSVTADRDPEIKGEDGLRALKVIYSARKAFEKGMKTEIA